MKKYYVYLDESGDFESDETLGRRKKGSLVGGFFYNQEDMPKGIGALERKIKSLINGENHATEVGATQKGEKVFSVLSKMEDEPIKFVIFQNDLKKKIINSTQTYLTVITEGLVQLMKKLIILENEPVEINVVVGFKKDTTRVVTSSYTEGYIDIDEYRKRMLEKLAVEKAKLRNADFQSSLINIELEDDKKNSFLILSDYICNFWYTSRSQAFSGRVKWKNNEVSIRVALKSLYDQDYVFPLFNTEENEHVLRMVQDGCIADALFEMCAGMISESNCRLVRESFLKLKTKQIHNQLDNLADYIGDIIVFQNFGELASTVLDGAENLHRYLVENSINEMRFYLDIQLYRLAVLDNTGQTEKMEQIFNKVEPFVSRYTAQTVNVDYLLIYYTRKAVYLQDYRRYKESCEVCENMELLLQLVEDAVKSNDCIKLEGDLKSEQLGKILGTKLQAQIPLCYLGLMEYDEACETSDRAISQFAYQHDLNRQYQYRAELEAVCGHQDKAIEWLEKSFGGVRWKKHIAENPGSIFDIYNLLFVAAFTRDICQKRSIEIANQIFINSKSVIDNNQSLFPSCYLLMGYSFIGDQKMEGRGKAVLIKAKKTQKNYMGGEYIYVFKAIKELLEGESNLKALYENNANA